MIALHDLSLRRGPEALLEHAELVIHPGQRVALVGANGTGKSSLFQLLLGKLGADGGECRIPAQWRIAHMAQEVAATERTARDYVIDGDTELRRLEREIEEAERRGDDHRLARLHQSLDSLDGYSAPARASRLLSGLGFDAAEQDAPVSHFSGGWRIRLNLAQALMCPSDLLLLDEPTNHLDLDATLWLEQWLRRYAGTLLLISHDRDFIDNVCERVVHIEHKRLNDYSGNYSAFEKQRAERLAQQQARFEKQQRRIGEIQRFVDRFRAKATKARQAQSRLKELDRMEALAPAHFDSPFDFEFAVPDRQSDPLLSLADVDLGYSGKTVLSAVNLTIHPGSRLALLGANGAGKSTLIKTLAGVLTPLAGERVDGEHLRTGYFSQHQLEALDLNASALLHLRRESPETREQALRDFLGRFDFCGDKALESVTRFSGGEKARLALALIVWRRPNLLLLDEPTNHLDLEMRHALSLALQTFEGAVVLVSHDRHLIKSVADRLLLVDGGRVDDFDGDLDDYTRWLLARLRETPDNNKVSEAVTTGSAAHRKARRREDAARRRQLKPLKQAIDEKEARLAQIDEALTDIEQRLTDTALYSDAGKDALQKLLREQGELKNEKDAAETAWLELSERFEAES